MTPDYDEWLSCRALRDCPDEELVGLILSGKPGGSERIDAAAILGYRRCPEAVPALIEMLREGWPHSVAAADALAKIGDPTVVPHIERVYEDCKAICAGTHLHWDANRLRGILEVLLRLRSEANLKGLLQEGDRLEGWLAWREFEKRRAIRRLREFLSQRKGMVGAVVALYRSGEVQGWTFPYAVEVITGLPYEDARYLVYCALRER